MDIPDIKEIIEETDKNYRRISALKIEEISYILNRDIKKASSKGLSTVRHYILNEFNGVINTLIENYRKAGYSAYLNSDNSYIEISWLK